MAILILLVTLTAMGLAGLAFLYVMEIIAGGKVLDGQAVETLGSRPVKGKIAVLIPAHNEAAGIKATLASVKAQLRALDRIMVVADNCTDETAEYARAAGAEVVERFSETKRGKGYALDYGIQQLREDPPNYVVMIDADCLLADGAIDALTACVAETGRPVQGLYLIRQMTEAELGKEAEAESAPAQEDKRVALSVSDVALRIKNHMRPAGLHLMGGFVPLTGSGMAFPWDVISDIKLATGALAEDMKLGLELGLKGQGAGFCGLARIDSPFSSDDEASRVQHRRWVHGHMEMALTVSPKLLFKGLIEEDRRKILLALDSLIPPTVFFGLILGAGLGITLLLSLFFAGFFGAFLVFVAAIGFYLVGLSSAWRLAGKVVDLPPPSHLGPYGVRAVRNTISGLFRRDKDWVRTKRDDEDHT